MTDPTLPSVLHFLQREFGRFEAERGQWAHDRAQLQARVAFLEGQRQGEANLKYDLMRRIKMLEFALQRERAKNSGGPEPTAPAKTLTAAADVQNTGDGPKIVREGREILISFDQTGGGYLKEMGYTDDVIRAQAQRVKGMLESWPPGRTVTPPPVPQQQQQQLSKQSSTQFAPVAAPTGPSATRAADDDDDNGDDDNDDDDNDDNDDDDDDDDAPNNDTPSSVGQNAGNDSSLALAELDFLDSLDAGDDDDDDDDDEASASALTAADFDSHANSPEQDDVLQEETFSAQRIVSGVLATPNIVLAAAAPSTAAAAPVASDDNDFLATATDDELAMALRAQIGGGKSKSLKMFGSPAKSASSSGAGAQKKGRGALGDLFHGPPAGTELDLTKELGELANLDVNNDNRVVPAASLDAQPVRKSWKPKASLRSHLDSVRALAFHPGNDTQLLSAAEDGTVKVWELALASKKPLADIEPAATFRGHSGPVFALAVGGVSGLAFSAGADTTIRSWRIPAVGGTPYEPRRSPVAFAAGALGHTDAVWALDLSPDESRLLSAGADGTLRLWAVGGEHVAAVGVHAWTGGPVSRAEFVRTNSRHIIVAGTNGCVSVVDAETGQLVVTLGADEETPFARVFGLRSHATMALAVTGHADRTVRTFDLTAGVCSHSMIAHESAVSAVDFDPSGLTLVTGGHDRSVRLWDLTSHACVDEITTHRPKFDEAIHDVKFHPTLQHFASAGADSVVKVYK